MASESARTSSMRLDGSSLQAGAKRKQPQSDGSNTAEAIGVRRRITRACDQCNQLRTKCDGKQPCVHCLENNLSCDYARVHKKRGRVPKKEHEVEAESNHSDHGNGLHQPQQELNGKRHTLASVQSNGNDMANHPTLSDHGSSQHGATNYVGIFHGTDSAGPDVLQGPPATPSISHPFFAGNDLNYPVHQGTEYMTGHNNGHGFGFPLGDDYSVAFMGKAPVVESPDWLMMAPDMTNGEQLSMNTSLPEGLRYPVLLPLVPHLDPFLSPKSACDLLEQYFTSANTHLRPKNPYVIGSVFRKKSVLHPSNPRPCSPALLASMLWISAQHSDEVFLTSQPDARSRTCQKLLELTIAMLRPLVHNHHAGGVADTVPPTDTSHADATIVGLVSFHDNLNNPGASRTQLDHIITYMHLGTVVSASERKAASLRWWNAAWSLAREIRLGREILPEPANEERFHHGQSNSHVGDQASIGSSGTNDNERSQHTASFSEEYREERRRVFWLLYMTDRHLALCYNRPMFFLNQECEALWQPVSDEIWQSDLFDTLARTDRGRGLDIRCTSHSVFGYFLPLMVLLGEILNLNYARNRPQLGRRKLPPRKWNENVEEILHYLKEFEESIHEFEQTGASKLIEQATIGTSPVSGTAGVAQGYDASEARLQTDIVVAYSRHIMHVLHILLTGKWDPIALLDDNDLWISSQSFVTATGHAVSAANDLADIIEYDPDLSLIPYFFGIYLLQGSFLLLLFADKLQDGISPDVVKACETIVRAHEACVATLDTQYQRNFRKVMRSALQQLRGRIREDPVEQQNWRRGILKLYRWTGDGTGLAL